MKKRTTLPPSQKRVHRKLSFATGYRELAIRTSAFSFRLRLRLAITTLILFGLAIAASTIAISLGEFPMELREVLAALVGIGKRLETIIVLEWRLPVAIAAVIFGALLGIGGAIFQSLTHNPLGSPDIIGFDAGSYTAVVVLILVIGSNQYWAIAAAAIIGGLVTAFIVYILSWRRGIQGFRLIIVGIAISAMLTSINSYLITRAQVEQAVTVGFWAAGSISRVSWHGLIPTLALGLVIVGCAAALSRSLHHLELGDDAAWTQGFSVGRARLGLIVVGVATTAVVTAAAGPISFIALAAPQIARRITQTPGVSLLSAAAMGSALLSGAHLLSLVIATFYYTIPVGLITVIIGGMYMIWLLIRETRREYGALR